MVIDMHVHPGFYGEISQDKNEIDFRKKAMGWDLMSAFPVDLTRVQMDFAGVAEEEILLDKDEYFVLGDNRNASEDSRNADIGNVRRRDIYGMAWFVRYPGDNFGRIP